MLDGPSGPINNLLLFPTLLEYGLDVFIKLRLVVGVTGINESIFEERYILSHSVNLEVIVRIGSQLGHALRSLSLAVHDDFGPPSLTLGPAGDVGCLKLHQSFDLKPHHVVNLSTPIARSI